MSEYAFEGAKRGSSSIAWSFETQTLSVDESMPFSNPIAAAYQSTIRAAFVQWASVSGLTFTQVADSSTVPIRIGFEAFAKAGELGETDFSYGRGLIGNDTLIRLLDPAASPLVLDAGAQYVYAASNVTLLQVTLHEIGHALGLNHTTDPYTIMYPYASTPNRNLAAGDIEGINALYPYFTVAAVNPVQSEGAAGQTEHYDFVVTRYSDPSVALTINYTVSGAPYPSMAGSAAADAAAFARGAFPSGPLNFAAGSATATLSIAVAGNSAPQPDAGFVIGLASPTSGDSVTVRGQVNALILDDDGYGLISGSALGIYRFFDVTNGAHFFSASEAERNTLIQTRPDLIYEGIGLHAVAVASTDAATAPVYRFFDLTTGTHFYSISPGERDVIQTTRPDLAFEGAVFAEHTTAQTGDSPVYRFFDVSDGTHFFTSSPSERATILATRPDLRDEGVAFYAPST